MREHGQTSVCFVFSRKNHSPVLRIGKFEYDIFVQSTPASSDRYEELKPITILLAGEISRQSFHA